MTKRYVAEASTSTSYAVTGSSTWVPKVSLSVEAMQNDMALLSQGRLNAEAVKPLRVALR